MVLFCCCWGRFGRRFGHPQLSESRSVPGTGAASWCAEPAFPHGKRHSGTHIPTTRAVQGPPSCPGSDAALVPQGHDDPVWGRSSPKAAPQGHGWCGRDPALGSCGVGRWRRGAGEGCSQGRARGAGGARQHRDQQHHDIVYRGPYLAGGWEQLPELLLYLERLWFGIERGADEAARVPELPPSFNVFSLQWVLLSTLFSFLISLPASMEGQSCRRKARGFLPACRVAQPAPASTGAP